MSNEGQQLVRMSEQDRIMLQQTVEQVTSSRIQDMNTQNTQMLQSFEERLNAQFARMEERFLNLRSEATESTSNETPIPIPTAIPTSIPLPRAPTFGEAPSQQIVKAQLPLKEPRKYGGERKNGACEQWCMDMYSFLQRFEKLTRTNIEATQAVEYVTQYFEGAALTWWTNLQFQVNKGLTTRMTPTTIAELFEELQQAFGDIHSIERRREKYEALRQTSSVRDFANSLKHQVLFLDPIPSEYEILRRFQTGLRTDIRAKMEENHGHIRDLDTYIKKADDVDRALYRVRQLQKSASNETQGQNYGMGSEIPNAKADPKGHKRWCIENKACFKCNSKEHISRDCLRTKDSGRKGNSKGKQSRDSEN
jgi:uncharacterized coiled-coil protein SlyX